MTEEAMCGLSDNPKLVELRKLTEEIVQLEDLVALANVEIIELKMGDGKCFLKNLENTGNYAVARGQILKGSNMPLHTHDEWEFFVMVEGEMTFRIDGEKRFLKVFDHMVVPPGVPHEILDCPVNSTQIAITIPANNAFPGGDNT